MGNIEKLRLSQLAIKELPVSFQNLTGLHRLIAACDFLQLNSLALTPSLTKLEGYRCKEWKWVNPKDGEEVGSTISSNILEFSLTACNLNDDFFSAGFTQLATQQLHEAGETDFIFGGGSIPRWLDKESRGPSISFWFRNQFPHKVLCLLIAPLRVDFTVEFITPVVLINGKVQEYHLTRSVTDVRILGLDHTHTYLFDLHELPFLEDPRKMASEKEWKHVEITYQGLFPHSFIKAMGIHIVKEESRDTKDIRYDDPSYTTTKMWPCNFFLTFLPFFFCFFLALILFTSLMAYSTQL
ncbi:hypothetical protein DEO72_LG5g598 [Vigna unguiculata]|uniref:Uncharacterized protein n=1 Tax=Vigna unguiculata TaxID=3917 RepID=A0A4D6LUB2_VIGUN|nr:hypothetical protein DEO72_LG5g598 [Vigna unguiculata]